MSEPIKAWAIKMPYPVTIDAEAVGYSEAGVWRRACELRWSEFKDAEPMHSQIKQLADKGYRAVRVEIREVEE